MALSYKFFRIAFAATGDVAAIPDATQVDGSVSFNQGFGPDYQADPGSDPDAKDVPRDQTNQLYNYITAALQYLQVGKVPEWISAADNGGSSYSYGFLSRVLYTDGYTYTSLEAANTDTPGSSVKWARDRLRLTQNTTFYVRTDGSNSNTGLANNAGGAWLTLQGAVDNLMQNWDFNGYTVTINIAAGTYNGDISVVPFVGQRANITFNGVGATTIINGQCTVSVGGHASFQNMKVQNNAATGSVNCFVSGDGGALTIGAGIEVGSVPNGGAHFYANVGVLFINNSYTISGDATNHWQLFNGGKIVCGGNIANTVTGSRTFTNFLSATQLSMVTLGAPNATWTGTVTGKRYEIEMNSTAYVNSGGANVFPGNVAGSASTGAQYL